MRVIVQVKKSLINDKGFTLVEILAVITILSLLMVFVVPNFLNLLNKSKASTIDIQKQMIISAARLYVEDCNNLQNKNVTCNFTVTDGKTIIDLNDLISNGYINEVKNKDKTCNATITVKNEKYSVKLIC